ncbi:MAG: cysteine-rich CWC family protein [Pseudolabrys sp.]
MPPPTAIAPRHITCARCGAAFECGLAGDCWCAAEPSRLPMSNASTAAQEDCLCPACLRREAAGAAGR